LSNICTTADNAAYDMTVHAAMNYNEITTTYPGTFYFSFVGTRARHRSSRRKGGKERREGQGEEEEEEEEEGRGWGMTRMVKQLAYTLMGWHVQSVNYR